MHGRCQTCGRHIEATTRPRRTCMKLDPSTFVRSVAGKAVLATGVVLLAYGGAAAAGFTEVPELIPQEQGTDNPELQPETSDDSTSVAATDESSSEETDVDESS